MEVNVASPELPYFSSNQISDASRKECVTVRNTLKYCKTSFRFIEPKVTLAKSASSEHVPWSLNEAKPVATTSPNRKNLDPSQPCVVGFFGRDGWWLFKIPKYPEPSKLPTRRLVLMCIIYYRRWGKVGCVIMMSGQWFKAVQFVHTKPSLEASSACLRFICCRLGGRHLHTGEQWSKPLLHSILTVGW